MCATVVPSARQWGPPAFSAMFPPMEAAAGLPALAATQLVAYTKGQRRDFDLPLDRRFGALSQGHRTRLTLALALTVGGIGLAAEAGGPDADKKDAVGDSGAGYAGAGYAGAVSAGPVSAGAVSAAAAMPINAPGSDGRHRLRPAMITASAPVAPEIMPGRPPSGMKNWARPG